MVGEGSLGIFSVPLEAAPAPEPRHGHFCAVRLRVRRAKGFFRGSGIGVSIDPHVSLFAHKARPSNRSARGVRMVLASDSLKFSMIGDIPFRHISC